MRLDFSVGIALILRHEGSGGSMTAFNSSSVQESPLSASSQSFSSAKYGMTGRGTTEAQDPRLETLEQIMGEKAIDATLLVRIDINLTVNLSISGVDTV